MKAFSILFLLAFVSCGHHRDVRPGSTGLHRVIVATDDTQQGQREAIAQANHYCDQYEKKAAFEDETSKYSGTMDEKTYRSSKMITKAGRGTSANPMFGALDSALGNGYTIAMTFRCI